MKTQIKTLIAAILTVISLTSAVFTTSVSAKVKEPRALIVDQKFRKISVSGNVELLIVQNKKEGVVYDEKNIGEAYVTTEGDLLRITSKGKQTAKLIVYVNDFYRIEASENAIVKNYGTLNLKYLQIYLKDNATADINSKTTGLYSVLNNAGNLTLSGVTENHILAMSKTAKLTLDQFDANMVNNNSEDYLAKAK